MRNAASILERLVSPDMGEKVKLIEKEFDDEDDEADKEKQTSTKETMGYDSTSSKFNLKNCYLVQLICTGGSVPG